MKKTGIQELNFNTLYQLFVHDREQLAQADKILMVPDYLYYRLTGIMVNETTNASTMQLLNVNTRGFDEDLLSLLQLRRDQFSALAEPNLPAFLNPDSMTLEIQRFCEETEQPIPRTPGSLARCIFDK